MNTNQKNQTKYALISFLAVVTFVITYKYSLNLLNTIGLNDLREHTIHAESIYLNTLKETWLQRPYFFWHLCVKVFIKFWDMPTIHASACACSCFASFTVFVTFWILDKSTYAVTKKEAGLMSSFVSFLLAFVMSLYIPWITPYQYEGQFAINPFFNPTHMAVKPFGLLCFAAGIDLILRYKEKETIFFTGPKAQKWLYVIFGSFLFMSTITKPTFMYMLLPAGVIYVLIELNINLFRKDGSIKTTWNFMWKLACACIPSLIYLLLEYAAFYFWGGTNSDASIAIYPFLTAWHVFSANVPKSILMAMSFPFWMVLTNPKYFFHSVEGRLSCLGYIIGTLEFAFFVETGEKLEHLNFAWPLMSGMLLLWVTTSARLIHLTVSENNSFKNRIVVTVGWFLLGIYFFSGLYYINPHMYII